jgi:hypothetical protein
MSIIRATSFFHILLSVRLALLSPPLWTPGVQAANNITIADDSLMNCWMFIIDGFL